MIGQEKAEKSAGGEIENKAVRIGREDEFRRLNQSIAGRRDGETDSRSQSARLSRVHCSRYQMIIGSLPG